MRFILLLAAKILRSISKKGLGPRYKIDEYYNCKVETKIIPTDHGDVRVLLYWPQTPTTCISIGFESQSGVIAQGAILPPAWPVYCGDAVTFPLYYR